LQAIVRLDGLAAVTELDAYSLSHNFGDTLTRQNEHYYRKIHLRDSAAGHGGAGIASAHDRVSYKHEIGPHDLTIDSRPRALFLDTFEPTTGEAVALVDYEEREGSERSLVFASSACPVEKTIELAGKRLSAIYRFSGKAAGTFTTEINLAMPSCDGPAGKFIVQGRIPGGFGQPLEFDDMKEIVLDDDVLGGTVKLTAAKPVHCHSSPYFSVSQSEAGFEKIMQAVTLTLQWQVPAGKSEMRIELEIGRKKS